MELLIHYNTALPFSATVERLFSVGKDILKPKRSGLSDNHFEMLPFWKAILLLLLRSSYQSRTFVWFENRDQ